MFYKIQELQPPGAEPLTLDEMKLHLRVQHDADDALISSLIASARQICEQETRRSLITRTYALFLDCWPSDTSISLPHPPLVSVTLVQTYDVVNTATTFSSANYFVDALGSTPRLVMTSSPPTAGRDANGIEIRYTAGYGATPAQVPHALRQGIKQLVTYLYENRGDDAAHALHASGAATLFQPYRVMGLL